MTDANRDRAWRGRTTGAAQQEPAVLAVLLRGRAAAVLALGVVAIIGASAIGLNEWADVQATSTSAHPAPSGRV